MILIAGKAIINLRLADRRETVGTQRVNRLAVLKQSDDIVDGDPGIFNDRIPATHSHRTNDVAVALRDRSHMPLLCRVRRLNRIAAAGWRRVAAHVDAAATARASHRFGAGAGRCGRFAARARALDHGHVLHDSRGVEVENAAAAFADHDGFALFQILENLGAKYDVAAGAASTGSLRDRYACAAFANAFVVRNERRRHVGNDAGAFGFERIDLCLMDGYAFTGSGLLSIHMLFLFGEGSFGSFNILIERLGVIHQLENAVFGLAGFLAGEIDFVLEGAVLVVVLRVHHLRFELRDLLFVGLDFAFETLAVALVAGERGLIEIETAQVRFELFLDFGDVFGKSGNFLCQRGDRIIEDLKADGVLNIWKHWLRVV